MVEVRAKLLYQVELGRGALDQMWGFSVEAELVENSDRQDELCCYVSRVEERSVAMNNGKIFYLKHDSLGLGSLRVLGPLYILYLVYMFPVNFIPIEETIDINNLSWT